MNPTGKRDEYLDVLAAAPDLYKELKELVKKLESALTSARLVLNKAEGKEEA